MKRILTNLLLFFLPICVFAQKPVKVEGEYTYYGKDTESVKLCKDRALEGARLQALEKEFGVKLFGDVYQGQTVNSQGESHIFDAQNKTSVMGEWIADDDVVYDVKTIDDCPVVYCKVKGRAKALSNELVDFTARTLRNGSVDDTFRSGDLMSLEFRAPVDGYIAVFLTDKDTVYTLLPYLSNTSGFVKIKRGVDYVFFDPEKANKELNDAVDAMVLSTTADIERNRLCVVFSPNAFTRPNDKANGTAMPRSLSIQEFNRWLTDCKSKDKRFSTKEFNLIIKQ